MKAITLQQIKQAVGGKAVAPIPANLPAIHAVCTDTRFMQPSSLFVALRGERFDGHAFLPEAAAAGAIAALVDHVPDVAPPNVHLVLVPDTRAALGRLACFVRKQLRAKVIAVAGSNGKTSTKYLIHAALSKKLRGTFSPKSFNNDIGVPLTIFPAEENQDYLVLEMGTNHPGEIPRLTRIGLPDIAVLTNTSAEHLEGLGDLMGVRRENASIVDGLSKSGLLIVNGDDAELLSAVSSYAGKRLTFGFKESNDLFASDIRCDESGVRFRLNNSRREVFIPLLGRHTACNALAAIAVGRKLGVSEDLIVEGLASAVGPDMRLQWQSILGVRIVNDAYNANPASMTAALQTMAGLPTTGRRIAILGDMLELGESGPRLHREIGALAAECHLDGLMCVGPNAELIAESAQTAGMNASLISRFPNSVAVAEAAASWFHAGDLVLLKGSRGMRLERVAEALTQAEARTMQKAAS